MIGNGVFTYRDLMKSGMWGDKNLILVPRTLESADLGAIL